MTRLEFIRKLAYEIWEKEGRPDGKDLDHWLQASAVVRDMPTYDGIADMFEEAEARRQGRKPVWV